MKLVKESLNEFINPKTDKYDLEDTVPLDLRSTKRKTVSYQVLKFIESKGEEGVGLTEIQDFIYFEIHGNDRETDDYFYSKTTDGYTGKPSGRKSRGYWNTQLYGGGDSGTSIGLLKKWCRRNEKGKWVLDKLPIGKENIY